MTYSLILNCFHAFAQIAARDEALALYMTPVHGIWPVRGGALSRYPLVRTGARDLAKSTTSFTCVALEVALH